MRIPLFQELINILRNKVVDLDIFIAKACAMENFPNAKPLFLGSLFEKLYKKVGEGNKNVKILNYFSDPRFQGTFEQEFFLDSDHLNLKGAELLTSLFFEEGGIEK